ncbi:MAG: phosphoserine phosphatase [Candidatus Thermoplasmatota archaeon]|nr:phosphoserine phosphatase [Candidatus Thermoplasmatota archaeon]
MSDYLEALEDKRNKLNSEAESHRKKRDRLNQETKQHAETRDDLNAQVKKLLMEANRFKEKRDEYNQLVREEKVKRDELTMEYNNAKAELDEIRKSRPRKDDEISIGRLRKDLRALEFKQMTEVLDAKKERDLIDKISTIKKQLESREQEMEASDDLRELLAKVRETRARMDDCHKQVNEYADLAQNEHDSMIERFNSSDKLRKEADRGQEAFVDSKIKADEEHHKHVNMIHLVHDLDRLIFALRNKRRGLDKRTSSKMQAPSPQSGKMEAERIFEKFKNGEKLSTEDLMVLQKHGFL